MRFFFVIADVFRYQRRRVLLGAAVLAVAVVAVLAAPRLFAPGTPVEPFPLALAVCEGSGLTLDEESPSQATWAGSHDADSAELRCAWSAPTPEAVAEHLGELGYTDTEITDGTVDYLGRDGAWVVNAEAVGELTAVSVGGLEGVDSIDVYVGGFIHIHDDGTQHRHGPDGSEITD